MKYLSGEIQGGRFAWVIDADIAGLFDNINHEKMIEMLEHKISDVALIWHTDRFVDLNKMIVNRITSGFTGNLRIGYNFVKIAPFTISQQVLKFSCKPEFNTVFSCL